MKVSEIVRLLKKNGWYLDEHGSDHDLYRHPIKSKRIPVPRHQSKELNPKTAISILKDAGLR